MDIRRTASATGDPQSAATVAPRRNGRTRLLAALASLPFLGFLVGVVFVDRVKPFIFGFPCLLAWILLWIVLTSAVMGAIYVLDPENSLEEEVEQ